MTFLIGYGEAVEYIWLANPSYISCIIHGWEYLWTDPEIIKRVGRTNFSQYHYNTVKPDPSTKMRPNLPIWDPHSKLLLENKISHLQYFGLSTSDVRDSLTWFAYCWYVSIWIVNTNTGAPHTSLLFHCTWTLGPQSSSIRVPRLDMVTWDLWRCRACYGRAETDNSSPPAACKRHSSPTCSHKPSVGMPPSHLWVLNSCMCSLYC